MNEKSISEIIKTRREELNYSMQEIADYVGVTRQTVFKWEHGFIKNMGIDKLEKLASILQVEPLDLLNIHHNNKLQKVTLTEENYNAELPPSNVCMIDDGNIKMIPLFGSVSAGFGSCEEEYLGMIPIVKVGSVENYVAVTVRGDSMEDRIMDKSIIVVNKNVPIYDGEVGIFRVNDDVFVKQKIIKDKKTYLHSFNDYYEDIEIREYDYYVELGKVVETITKW